MVSFTAEREGEGGEVRLLSGLDNDAATVPDLDAQVMVVEHGHAQQRGGVRFVSVDKSRLPVPKHRHPIGVKYVPSTVG